MGQIGMNRMTTKLTPCVSSYYTETYILHFKSCIFVHPHHLEIIRTGRTNVGVTQHQWHIEGSGFVSRIWQLQYGTTDISRYSIMWCYMLSTLTNEKKLEALSYWFHCNEGGNNKAHGLEGGVNPQMTLFIWMTWCKRDVLQCVSNGVTSFLH